MTSKSSPAAGPLVAVQRDIASMKTRGAGEIGKQAALALAAAADAFGGTDVEAFRAEMMEAARLLARARPTAVSLRNGLNFVLDDVMAADTVEKGRAAARARADEFARRVTEAKSKIAVETAKLLHHGDPILTHCHSTAAIGALAEAQRQGKDPRVFSTETRPFRQGLLTSRALKEAGVNVTLIVDSAALHVLEEEKVRAVVLGADAVGANGALYNKIGTRLITLAAKSLGIPVYVCAESYKFSPYTLRGEDVEIEERAPAEIVSPEELPGVRVHNPVFDRTPPDQITLYITEEGPLEPGRVADFIRRHYGGAKAWI